MNGIDITNFNAFLAVLAAGGISVAGVLQFLKKFLTREKKMVHVMFVALAVVAAAAQYILQYHSHLPLKVLGVSLAGIYGVAGGVYNWSKLVNKGLAKVYGGGAPAAVAGTTAAITYNVAGQTEPSAAQTADEPVTAKFSV